MKKQLEYYFDRLWPLNRSLTGNGNRETLKILSEIIPLEIHEVPAGTKCFDWTVPPEWNVNEAWIKDEAGNLIVDFSVNNLHLLGYSVPFEGCLSFDELKDHLYSLPDQPDLIPYLTSYYSPRWGFCLTHNQLVKLNKSSIYTVKIDATLDEKGSMTYGDLVLPGKVEEEILLTTYICHPSMANNELSGPLVTAFIYDQLKKRENYYTYRFAFVPETIGSINYLSEHGNHFKKKMVAGFVITCVGDDGNFTFKKSRRGSTVADRATELILAQTEPTYKIVEFTPLGSDERQYCSPGFNLPVCSLMRTTYTDYAEYHTSGDNKEFISFTAMEQTVETFLSILKLIDKNHYYVNQLPFCEPQLGKRGLYPTLGSQKGKADEVKAMMWILNLADGEHDLIEIIERCKIKAEVVLDIQESLFKKEIIK